MNPTRRGLLRSLVGGSVLLPGLLSDLLRGSTPAQSHFAPKAKRVIFLYMSGGVSHVDTFDPKPQLQARHAQSADIDGRGRFLSKSRWEFRPGGRCGTQVSDLFPRVRECMDDICLIRSLHTDHGNHYEATLQIHTGSFSFARPSIGSWVSYGLGTENTNLPSFVVLAPHLPYAGSQVWASDFLPGAHQGVRVIPGDDPIPNLTPQKYTLSLQERELQLLGKLNRRHAGQRGNDPSLQARIKAFETAAGMQLQAPEAFDLTHETDATLALYGLQRGATEGFGWQCLIARRLVERGVRFVELIDTGASGNWDSHDNMSHHEKLARNVDQPIAGLLRDLKSRGLLDETLVVWTTEFGRTPFTDSANHPGREHHRRVFSSWLAGGGTRPGTVVGSSDELGVLPDQSPVHVHDFHATILHLLGIDHERLTFRHGGQDHRLTNVAGKLVREILADPMQS